MPSRSRSVQGSNGGLVRALLRFPLYYKILVANAIIVALVTIGSVFIARAAAELVRFALNTGLLKTRD